MKMKKKFGYSVILVFFVLSIAGCITISTNTGTESWRDYFKPGCSKEEIAKDFNLYRGKWWNHYGRGRWYAEGGYYDEAIQDFKRAIDVRSKDQRSARSYGLHFLEYFAHRELGIVYYNQQKYEEAKRELEASLATADSARAKFYLNKCNGTILKTTQADQEPPQIKLSSHTDGEIVNTPSIKLSGFAVDDCYVSSIYVQGKKLFTELAKKDLEFCEVVSLHAGDNMINLEATDLTGKSAQRKIRISLDMRPPLLYLDDVQVHSKDGRQVATVKGTIVDDYGLKEFYINDTEFHVHSSKEDHFEEDIVLTGEHKLSFRVSDIAGNETRGEQNIDIKASLWQRNILDGNKHALKASNKPILLAAAKLDKSSIKSLLASLETQTVNAPQEASAPEGEKKSEGTQPSQSQNTTSGDNMPPVLKTDIKSAIVYDSNFFLSGDARDDGGIAKLFVNQQPVEIRPGKHVFFNQLLTLNDGENNIVVKAVDTQGNETQLPPVKITKKAFELLESDARYTVALLPLRTYTEQGVPSESIYSMLLTAFDEEPKRFNFVERDKVKLEEILKEQKLSNTDLALPETAIKIGKLHAAEGMLFGSVEEDAKGVNITLRLVDTETTQVLANVDVYDEDKSIKNLEWLTHGLSLKMKQQFPMIQGNVVFVSGNGFHVSAGATSGVGVGMKLLLFREIKEGDFVLKEPLDAVARVVQVQPDTCFAKIITSKGDVKVDKKDFVITK